LKIHWPHFTDPSSSQGFESLARKYRFRLLGKACKDRGIDSLLLAHHEDDQAETVLMRMIAGHRLAGLSGIRACSEIPENYGVHGVHESGGSLQGKATSLGNKNDISKSTLTVADRHAQMSHHLVSENGGIKIYRPLLGFSKARLVATCEAQRMKWFEDYTNKDPTLTKRNAIRHMYANHKMPAALSKSSVLGISERMRERLAVRKAVVDRWLQAWNVSNFETRSGTIIVQFRSARRLRLLRGWSTSEKKQMAAELLRRVIMLVTPEKQVEVASLHGAVSRLFPELDRSIGAGLPSPPEKDQDEEDLAPSAMDDEAIPAFDEKEPTEPSAFTVAGVLFKFHTSEHENPHPDAQLTTQKPFWHLSRQAPHAKSTRPSPVITVPCALRPEDIAWSPWQLFDGRYWIRVQNRSSLPLKIKHFERKHLSELKQSSSKVYRKEFQDLLKKFAKGSVRWTLPVIVLDKGGLGIGAKYATSSEVLVLPTLDIKAAHADELVRYEVRYKKIYTDGITLTGHLLPPTTSSFLQP
jgi:tRNA(Ile)-lysidine synthase